MRSITKINIEESVARRKLIFEEPMDEVLDGIYLIVAASMLVFLPLGALSKADFENPNDKFLSFTLLPLCILAGIYLIYRKATEKHLYKITSPCKRAKNRQILLHYASMKQYKISRKSNDCLIFNDCDDFSKRVKSIVVILSSNEVLFTIVQETRKIHGFPTLTAHLFLRRDLNRLFKSFRDSESFHELL